MNSNWFPHTDFRALLSQMNPEATHPGGWNRRGRRSPPGSYDVVLSDAEYVIMLRDGGFIEQMNPADYPFADFWPEFQKFEGHWLDGKLYSVITRFGYLGLGYRTDVLSADDVKSYKVLWDGKIKGKVGFFDWYTCLLWAASASTTATSRRSTSPMPRSERSRKRCSRSSLNRPASTQWRPCSPI
jgi:hypothetical protein